MGQALYPTGVGGRTVAVMAAAAVCLLLAYAPKSAADSKWYVGVNTPVMYIDDTDTVTEGVSADHTGMMLPSTPYRGKAVTKYDTGYKLEAVLGYELGSRFRIEAELFYATADVDKLTYSGISATPPQAMGTTVPIHGKVDVPVSGAADQLGAMVNLWYDFDTGSDWVPYVGVGVGFIEFDMGGLRYDDNLLVQEIANQGAVGVAARTLMKPVEQLTEAELAPFLAGAQLPPGHVPRCVNPPRCSVGYSRNVWVVGISGWRGADANCIGATIRASTRRADRSCHRCVRRPIHAARFG